MSPLLFPPPPTGLGTPAFFPDLGSGGGGTAGVGGGGTRKSQPSGANSETANSRQCVLHLQDAGFRGPLITTRLSCDTPPESSPQILVRHPSSQSSGKRGLPQLIPEGANFGNPSLQIRITKVPGLLGRASSDSARAGPGGHSGQAIPGRVI